MVKMTLDFRSSYRAITNADMTHQLARETLTFDGKDIPLHLVTFTSPAGDYVIPARTFAISTPYTLSHSASANHLDLYSPNTASLKPYLRFPIPVDGPPLWENYVQATYVNPDGLPQWVLDVNTFDIAVLAWINYLQTHPFKASAATLIDDGGQLGQFSSDSPTLIEKFESPTALFSSVIHGSTFNDGFAGGAFADTLYGGLGDDSLTGLAGGDGIFGGNGNDYLFGVAGIDLLFGGNGDDTMYGGTGSDVLKGGSDADMIYGFSGDDHLSGQAGTDLLSGDAGNDSLSGGTDSDTLNGGTGADTLKGDTGDDFLSGGDGKDVLYGGDGDDFLRGGLGNDTLTGGAGRDTFNFNFVGAANADRIVDFVLGTDLIALTRGAFAGVHAHLDAQEFRLGTAAQDGDDRTLYDSATGRLYYDPDGTLNGASSAAPVLFAIVANHAALTHQDFSVI